MSDDRASTAMFERNWRRYQTVVAHNLMYHREVYRELRRILVNEAARPFRFLDVACGDASCTVACLKETAISEYHGIDLSQPALDLAAGFLETLGCRFRLEKRDFFDALMQMAETFDVVWIGQSLHHLLLSEKRTLMGKIREIVGRRGLFLIWETVRLEGESEEGWYDRFLSNRPLWSALSDEDFAGFDDHQRAADHPETDEVWRMLGTEAGFARVDEIFRAPNDLARLYQFRACVSR